MPELEGSRELKDLAESSHAFVKSYMSKMNAHEPPVLFFIAQGILIPDPKDRENMIRVTKRFLEMRGICYAHCFIARLRDEDGNIVYEDALMVIASDSGDLTYHIAHPFTIERKKKQVVRIQWEEEQCGWQSRSKNRAHMQTLSPQQQRLLDYIIAESGMEKKPFDWLRLLSMRIMPYPVEGDAKK